MTTPWVYTREYKGRQPVNNPALSKADDQKLVLVWRLNRLLLRYQKETQQKKPLYSILSRRHESGNENINEKHNVNDAKTPKYVL